MEHNSSDRTLKEEEKDLKSIFENSSIPTATCSSNSRNNDLMTTKVVKQKWRRIYINSSPSSSHASVQKSREHFTEFLCWKRWKFWMVIMSFLFHLFLWAFSHKSRSPNIEIGSLWAPVGVERDEVGSLSSPAILSEAT